MYMITTSDIILEIILQQGYSGIADFCKENRLNYSNFSTSLRNNSWSSFQLNRLSKILRRELKHLTTVNNIVGDDD